MDPDAQERFEKVELRPSEHDEKFIAHDKSLSAIRSLLLTGMRMLVDLEAKMAALTDSEARLYGATQDLDARMTLLADAMRELAEAQKRTEESLRRFLDRSGDGRPA